MAVVEGLSRRDRVRAATVTEIRDTARRLLVADGPDGLTLRAIAREMGMTAPALYRYFPSREALLVDLIRALYEELADALEAARDAEPADDPAAGLAEASRAFRRWALDHRPEFGLLFGSPIPGVEVEPPADDASVRFGRVFADLVARVYAVTRFPVPRDADVDPALREQLGQWAAGFDLPVGVAQVFLSCWIRLYGMVALEVFDHLTFALGADAGPMFEAELADLAAKLGFAGRPAP